MAGLGWAKTGAGKIPRGGLFGGGCSTGHNIDPTKKKQHAKKANKHKKSKQGNTKRRETVYVTHPPLKYHPADFHQNAKKNFPPPPRGVCKTSMRSMLLMPFGKFLAASNCFMSTLGTLLRPTFVNFVHFCPPFSYFCSPLALLALLKDQGGSTSRGEEESGQWWAMAV